jgi:hypothetical protein
MRSAQRFADRVGVALALALVAVAASCRHEERAVRVTPERAGLAFTRYASADKPSGSPRPMVPMPVASLPGRLARSCRPTAGGSPTWFLPTIRIRPRARSFVASLVRSRVGRGRSGTSGRLAARDLPLRGRTRWSFSTSAPVRGHANARPSRGRVQLRVRWQRDCL